MNKYLHWDFDNTLAHSMYASSEAHADQLLETYGQYYEGEKFTLLEGNAWSMNLYWYVTFKRPWAEEILKYSQTRFGYDNVGILSWVTKEYVTKAMNVLGLDVPSNQIYTREDLDSNCPKFRNVHNVLVDNMRYVDHLEAEDCNKIKFLHYLPKNRFVKVIDFDVRYLKEENDEKIEDVIKNIERAFGSEISL